MQQTMHPAPFCRGTVVPPGDKSISHRALLFAALAKGRSHLQGLLRADDVLSTVAALRQLGVQITEVDPASAPPSEGPPVWQVEGQGGAAMAQASRSFAVPPLLDCGNSGTTLRLLAGALAGCGAVATLTGDASLRCRPMGRILEPLAHMGVQLQGSPLGRAPLTLRATPQPLRALQYALPVASAQVKGALLLAALGAAGTTTLGGRIDSRDHTERLLPQFGARLEQTGVAGAGGTIRLVGPQTLQGCRVVVPADPSSAAFFWAAAALVAQGDVQVRNVSLNPTRLGFLRVLQRMGARVDVQARPEAGEPVGDVRVQQAALVACEVQAQEVPSLIDELPLLAMVATQAQGTTRVRGAAELRHKECDRIAATVANVNALGGKAEALADGFTVQGPTRLVGAELCAYADHRVAMAAAIASLVAQGPSSLDDAACVSVSYPQFFATLHRLTQPAKSPC